MKFQIVSDLHLHFGKFDLPETDADVILLAGDLDDGPKAIDWLINQYKRLQKPIYFVLGNHEYYRTIYTEQNDIWRTALTDYDITLLDYRSNPYALLDGEEILLLGDTLWSDFNGNDPASKAIANYYMQDFQSILKAPDGFKAENALMEHWAALQSFREVRDTFWDKKCIIMTHHAPSYMSMAPKYVTERELNGAFMSNLEEFMGEMRCNLWIHGHTHTAFDYIAGMNTRVICNPRGIPKYDGFVAFNPSLVIEV